VPQHLLTASESEIDALACRVSQLVDSALDEDTAAASDTSASPVRALSFTRLPPASPPPMYTVSCTPPSWIGVPALPSQSSHAGQESVRTDGDGDAGGLVGKGETNRSVLGRRQSDRVVRMSKRPPAETIPQAPLMNARSRRLSQGIKPISERSASVLKKREQALEKERADQLRREREQLRAPHINRHRTHDRPPGARVVSDLHRWATDREQRRRQQIHQKHEKEVRGITYRHPDVCVGGCHQSGECTFAPVVSNASRQVFRKAGLPPGLLERMSRDIHRRRLDRSQHTSVDHRVAPDATFKPAITEQARNLKRDGDIFSRLYRDASQAPKPEKGVSEANPSRSLSAEPVRRHMTPDKDSGGDVQPVPPAVMAFSRRPTTIESDGGLTDAGGGAETMREG